MSNGASIGARFDGTSADMHQPRARKAVNKPLLARAMNGETGKTSSSDALPVPSEHGTPAPPDDAPPSVKATSAIRVELRRRNTAHRIFPTVEYAHRVSYFDPRSDYGNFRGFFVLFWVGLAIMVITAMLRNLKDTGYLLNFKQWPLFTQDIFELAPSDLLMVGSTSLAIPLHLLYRSAGYNGHLSWNKGGMVVQILFQAGWLTLWISWPFMREWSWTAQVYFTLHTLAYFMKLHSYAFYNGHLSTTYWRLKQLDQPIGPQTSTVAAVRYPTAYTEELQAVDRNDNEEENQLDRVLTPISQLRKDLARELTSPLGNVTYPQNLTAANFVDYVLCPTLCYELQYPRTTERSYLELFYKGLAVFGCVFLMTVTSEEFIIPVLDESQMRLNNNSSVLDGALIFAETVSRLLFPFMVTFLLVFLVIFEYMLGFFAEVTRFGDRQFFSDWWNSLDWLEFSREWNIPVHNWFRRHVYSASRGMKLSRPVAMAITFFTSALAHELVMGCITRKFRGYGFFFMMLQIPLMTIQRLPWVRDQQLFNNVMMWIFLILGESLLCALYVLV